MDQIIKGMTKAARMAPTVTKPTLIDKRSSPHPTPDAKGAMKEPWPTRGGELEDVKEALHDLEEEKGDWSKAR
jgi:hypothetical protein